MAKRKTRRKQLRGLGNSSWHTHTNGEHRRQIGPCKITVKAENGRHAYIVDCHGKTVTKGSASSTALAEATANRAAGYWIQSQKRAR
jgi:hypothetical protein